MTIQEYFAAIWQMLIGRGDGPLTLRLVFQPTVAAILAIRAGLKDAREGQTPYLRSMFTDPSRRGELLREGWKDIGKVFVIAVVLDVVYALIVHRWIFPGQALLIGTVLAIVPYALIRGPVTRIVRQIPRTFTKPDTIASPATTAPSAGPRWRYPVLFGVQTIGAFILFWNAVPLYRQILADPASHEARSEHLVWALSSIVLMQLGYWISDRVRPRLPQVTNAPLGHITMFFARMSFVFATSVFGFLFITQRPGFEIPVFRYAVTLLGLFSLYCYGQEMERLGRAFLGRSASLATGAPAQVLAPPDMTVSPRPMQLPDAVQL